MSGNAGSKEYFDPFQVFEVDQKPCYQLKVTILRGRNIVEAAKIFVDNPDPYVKLKLSSTLSPNIKFSAKPQTTNNEDSQDWNYSCSFLLDLQKNNILNIELYDEGVGTDKILGLAVFDLKKLEQNKLTSKTFTLECKGDQGPAEVDFEFLLEEDQKPDLRFSMCLCDEEKEFLEKRQHHIFESLKTLFGDKAVKSIHDVPGVGIVHSGGGFRSMVATCGVLQGLHEAGLLDVISYMTCLSGSTWYMSHLYAHPDWPDHSPRDLLKDFRAEVTSSFTNRLLRTDVMYKNVKAMKRKKTAGQDVSFTDFFGYLIGKTLQPNKLDAKLTDQATLLKSGKVPMPIFTACTVKNDVIASKFNEWVECTAFEVALAKYGIAMKTEHFGSKFFMGRLVKQYPEPPLHFFQGIWGSVWSITLQSLVNVFTKFGICCCKNRSLQDSIVPANTYAESVLIAKKLRADLHERDYELPVDEDVVMLNAKNDDVSNDSDEGDNTPAWYQHLHYSAQQNALNKFKDPEPTPKSKRANQVSPQKEEQKEEGKEEDAEEQKQDEEEEADPMTFLDEIVKLVGKDGIVGNKIGRAATVFNYLYGLDLKKGYPVSPFTHFSSKKNAKNPYPNQDVTMDTEQESMCVVDAGVSFKLPFPPLLRPQRNVDVFLSFDYSFRSKEYSPIFKELKSVEAWAKANNVPFPKIDDSICDKEGMKEVYIFQNSDDPLCPVVLHFPLVNLSFKDFKKPGVMRETKAEREFGNFEVCDDGENHMLNLTYDEKDFDRLIALMEYNVLNNSHMIKDAIMKRIEMKKQQRKSKMAVYEKAIRNMANEDVFQTKLCETLHLESIQKIPSSKKTVVERFMTLVHGNEDH